MSKIQDKEHIEDEIDQVSLPLIALRGIVGFPGVQLNIEIIVKEYHYETFRH